jgi:hypothetical protein
MIPMWEFAQKNDGLILYAHSKGASRIQADVNIRWRRSMMTGIVIAWKFAIEKLQNHRNVRMPLDSTISFNART